MQGVCTVILVPPGELCATVDHAVLDHADCRAPALPSDLQ